MSLGDLQAEVLGVLNRLRKASAREVMREISLTRRGRRVYTTVSTTLDRLHKRGLVGRTHVTGRGRGRYVYFPVQPRSQKKFVRDALHRLVNAFGPDVVASIYERTEKLPKRELTQLKRSIRRKSQK